MNNEQKEQIKQSELISRKQKKIKEGAVCTHCGIPLKDDNTHRMLDSVQAYCKKCRQILDDKRKKEKELEIATKNFTESSQNWENRKGIYDLKNMLEATVSKIYTSPMKTKLFAGGATVDYDEGKKIILNFYKSGRSMFAIEVFTVTGSKTVIFSKEYIEKQTVFKFKDKNVIQLKLNNAIGVA